MSGVDVVLCHTPDGLPAIAIKRVIDGQLFIYAETGEKATDLAKILAPNREWDGGKSHQHSLEDATGRFTP